MLYKYTGIIIILIVIIIIITIIIIIFIIIIGSSSNWIEWSTIQGIIAPVISKLYERDANLKFNEQD